MSCCILKRRIRRATRNLIMSLKNFYYQVYFSITQFSIGRYGCDILSILVFKLCKYLHFIPVRLSGKHTIPICKHSACISCRISVLTLTVTYSVPLNHELNSRVFQYPAFISVLECHLWFYYLFANMSIFKYLLGIWFCCYINKQN